MRANCLIVDKHATAMTEAVSPEYCFSSTLKWATTSFTQIRNTLKPYSTAAA